MSNLKRTSGDLCQLAENNVFDVIVQGCNCFNTFGSGLAKQVREQYPAAWEADKNTIKGHPGKLGTYTFAKNERADNTHFYIVNAYTQYTYDRNKDVFEYEKFQEILDKLSVDNRFGDNPRFGFPLIGCGLAGGNKDVIINMLEDFASKNNTTLVEYNVYMDCEII